MAASDAVGTNDWERIEEVGLKGESLSPHESEWHVLDNHQQNLSFSDVRPANIAVRHLEVEVEVASSFADALKARFTKSKAGDVEGGAVGGTQRKMILKDVSADFPAGTLTAIIGGSGSGKVRLHPHNPTRGIRSAQLPSLIDYLPQCTLSPYARIKSHHRWKHTIQWISRPSHSHQRLRHTDRRVASVPHCPGNPTLRCIPPTPVVHHFSTA